MLGQLSLGLLDEDSIEAREERLLGLFGPDDFSRRGHVLRHVPRSLSWAELEALGVDTEKDCQTVIDRVYAVLEGRWRVEDAMHIRRLVPFRFEAVMEEGYEQLALLWKERMTR